MKILVAEPHRDLRELIVLFLNAEFGLPVHAAANLAEARAVAAAHPDLSCVISEWELGDGTAASLHDSLHQAGSTANFVLCSGAPLESFPALKGRKIHSIRKPCALADLRDLISLLHRTSPIADSERLCRIETALLLKYGKTPGDLYIRLSEEKFVKTFKAEDSFDLTDFNSLTTKQVDSLYLSASDSKRFARDMADNLQSLAGAKSLPLLWSVGLSVQAHRLLTELNSKTGLNDDVQKLTTSCIELALRVIQGQPRLSEILSALRHASSNDYLSTHSIGLAHVSCSLAALLGWKSESNFYQLCLAAFLHDITLYDVPAARLRSSEIQFEQGLMDTEYLGTYLRHPSDAARLLQSIPVIPQDAVTVVRNHHERPDGSGFPGKLRAAKIDGLSTVFIVSHAVITRYFESGTQPLSEALPHLGPLGETGYFRKAVDALKNHLTPQEPS